ncbi:murein DD-endopeptidase MepM/ murein hydrolase activator NlpD [Sphingomonas jejuensis]|uniref:Murein DD-endopeptidase MepM/ murein hydrolase activator NlpD n=1 Tax=Sphingomonas jejuensis TaxID=904715 RepID=A0ABX0XNG2_9SPHN|nr:M23 family metallopeptidase [Sphingomonas jejuensis]NJC34235.1 murein DD-endopeptidase MepM/ murein hydrolase activator NlpD [Sphingomonas jejuensis]
MFQRSDQGFGAGGGVAALSLDQAIGPIRVRRQKSGAFDRFGGRFSDIDLAPDLGHRVFSADWFRGVATLGGLLTATWFLAPAAITPIPGAAAATIPQAQWEQARSGAISPLALGADTGRRMAATDVVRPLTETPERPQLELSATVGQGDGFARVLERAGVSKGEASQVGDLVSQALPLSDIKSGTRMDILLGRRPNKRVARPLDRLAFRARFDLKLSVERMDGVLRLVRTPIAVDDTPLRIQGNVGSSLYRAARAAGAPPKAIEAYLRAIGSRRSVSSIPSSARFDLIVAHRRAETGEVEVGELLYAGVTDGAKSTRLMRWTMDGKSQWFDADGAGERHGSFAMPVSGRMSSGFGMRRHPILGYSRMHKGQDFAARHGQPIYAVADGTVAVAGRNAGYGNFVRISHAGGLGTGYAHMSRIAVRGGARVRQGQVIGYVGSTGLSTGPHLHWEVYRNGVAVNPRSISFVTQARLSGGELSQFRSRLNSLMAVRGAVPAAPAQQQQAASGRDTRAR